MENTQTGKVLIIGQTYQVPSTDPNAQPFYKRELVLDCTRYNPINGNKIENYPKFEFINNNCPMLDGLQVGQLVTVSFSLSGRKSVKDGRENYFTNITGYRIVPYQRQGAPQQQQNVQQPMQPAQQAQPFPVTAPTGAPAAQPFPPAVDEDGNPINNDDLPF